MSRLAFRFLEAVVFCTGAKSLWAQTPSLKAVVLANEKKFSELQIQRKCDDAVRLLDAEHRGISVGIGTRSEFSSQCKSGDVIQTRETFSHVEFALLSPDAALVTYEDDANFLSEGKEITLKAHVASVWVKRGSDWLLGLHAATSIPFAVTEEGKVRLLYPDTSQSKEVSK